MQDKKVDQSFSKQLKGFSLTTAEIIYHLPDYPSLLQSYVWQDYDQHPKFPKLHGFLDFWIFGLRTSTVVCSKSALHTENSFHQPNYVSSMVSFQSIDSQFAWSRPGCVPVRNQPLPVAMQHGGAQRLCA